MDEDDVRLTTIGDFYMFKPTGYVENQEWFTGDAYVVDVELGNYDTLLDAFCKQFPDQERRLRKQDVDPMTIEEQQSLLEEDQIAFIEERDGVEAVVVEEQEAQNSPQIQLVNSFQQLQVTVPNNPDIFDHFMHTLKYAVISNPILADNECNVNQMEFQYNRQDTLGYVGNQKALDYGRKVGLTHSFKLFFGSNATIEELLAKQRKKKRGRNKCRKFKLKPQSWSAVFGVFFKGISMCSLGQGLIDEFLKKIGEKFGNNVRSWWRDLANNRNGLAGQSINHSFTDFCKKDVGASNMLHGLDLNCLTVEPAYEKPLFILPLDVMEQADKTVVDNYAKLAKLVDFIDDIVASHSGHLIICVDSESSPYDGLEKHLSSNKFCIVLQIAFCVDGVAHFYLIDLQSLMFEWKLLKCFYAVVFENTDVTVIGQNTDDKFLMKRFIDKAEYVSNELSQVSNAYCPQQFASEAGRSKSKNIVRVDRLVQHVAYLCKSRQCCKCNQTRCWNAFELVFGQGGNPVGLNSLCEKVLGFSVNKSEQLSDWAQRPLTRPQIVYGINDVHLLMMIVTKCQFWLDETANTENLQTIVTVVRSLSNITHVPEVNGGQNYEDMWDTDDYM